MTDQLSIYNGALIAMGSRILATLSDNVESRRVLDAVWNSGQFPKHCLEKGYWKHAMRTATLTPSVTTPPTGWTYAYDQPSDFVKTYSLCVDDRFVTPLQDFLNEGTHWYCEENPIYLRYVSNGASYGLSYALWPESFTRYVEHALALRVVKRITDAKTDADDLKVDTKRLLAEAKANDALKEPVKFPIPGTWQNARLNGNWGRRHQHPYR